MDLFHTQIQLINSTISVLFFGSRCGSMTILLYYNSDITRSSTNCGIRKYIYILQYISSALVVFHLPHPQFPDALVVKFIKKNKE